MGPHVDQKKLPTGSNLVRADSDTVQDDHPFSSPLLVCSGEPAHHNHGELNTQGGEERDEPRVEAESTEEDDSVRTLTGGDEDDEKEDDHQPIMSQEEAEVYLSTVVTGTGARYSRIEKFEALELLPFGVKSELGSRSNGTVKLVKSFSTGEQFAGKMVDVITNDPYTNAYKLATFELEIDILQTVDHDNIDRLVHGFLGKSYGLILMEHYTLGPINNHLVHLTKDRQLNFFTQILSAVRHLHSLNIVHRNIRLENILVRDRNSVVLTDFGLSVKMALGEKEVLACHSPNDFWSPELLVAWVHYPMFVDGFKVDSYALGVFLWCLLYKRVPDDGMQCLASLESDLAVGVVFNPILLHCARRLLEWDADARARVIDLVENVEHMMGGVKL